MLPGTDIVSSRSDQDGRLVVLSIDYDAETGNITYRIEAGPSEVTFVGKAYSDVGIRGIRMSESLEEFLLSYCAEDPAVVKRLVAATWRLIDGGPVSFPLTV
jgi:hypothetical protein